MKLLFLYWIYIGGGGHSILSLIPDVLDCENCSFGHSIESIECSVFFRATNQPGSDYRNTYDRFHSELSKLPSFRFHKKQRFLELKYLSTVSSLEPELNGDNTIGCEQLKAFALEFKDVIESLKNEPSLCNVDFDFQAFAKFIENSMIKIPASDRELQALANRSL
jgi:hypothetical protein